MDIIDTHCHPQMMEDPEGVIGRALEAGVKMICVGVDLESSRRAISLAERYEGLWASVGLHPNDPGEVNGFRELLSHPKVVAVGEVGLDYYRSADRKEEQIIRLKKFIEIAVEYDKPLIVHCRDAHDDMLSILPQHKGVIHSFTGTKDQALHYIERGYFIGLNGIITFARQYDEAIKEIPLEKILLETDSPYLAPVPHRGKSNEPSYIYEVAKKLAQLKDISVEQVIETTTRNSYMFIKVY